MNRQELFRIRKNWINRHVKYDMMHWSEFDYNILSNIMYIKRSGRGYKTTVNDVIIMADTETSKKCENEIEVTKGQIKYVPVENHVVAWTISIRAFDRNIVTLYGHKPSSCIECMQTIHEAMAGDETIIYFHNLAYDWVFLRKFMMQAWQEPEKQLNTKPHYPILIKFENGLIFKDSLILAQRKLEKWAEDLNAKHKKAVGKWDYDKIRSQHEEFSADELEYIEHDTLAGVECLNILMKQLNKNISTIPYTATGIPREDTRKIGANYDAHNKFEKIAPSLELQNILEMVYHGGFTHANRHLIDILITDLVKCYDFASSYPFVMLSEKYPMEAFSKIADKNINYILRNANDYAFMFKLILIRPRLAEANNPMPALQYSKCTTVINPILDNGRILAADYVEIYLTEMDLKVIAIQYAYDKHICSDVYVSKKDYLPRWLTDYIYKLFIDKTRLKGLDPVLYNIMKAKLNSIYGMHVQKPIKDNMVEVYKTGLYELEHKDKQTEYDAYIKRFTSILPYQWGVWVTAYAFYNLHTLGGCCDTWVYSDTDSCYGINWNEDYLKQYNDICKMKLQQNGYGPVEHEGKEYWLGVAEFDGSYNEFKVQGAKRYCGRSTKDGDLHITVAGVPKCGAKCLNDDINNFTAGFVFPGEETGKLLHTYIYRDDIYTDKNGNETGDSIDLNPCDYLLDSVDYVNWESVFYDEIEVQVYE